MDQQIRSKVDSDRDSGHLWNPVFDYVVALVPSQQKFF